MKLTFYHYVHCPFCIRVRMTLGLLKLPWTSKVIPYDDETTPVRLTGKKMLPIMEHDSGAMNESLDIMAFIDKGNALNIKGIMGSEEFKAFEAWLNLLGSPIHSLAMPYMMWTPEFNDASRGYFQKKKEEKRGPFKNLVKNQKSFIEQLEKEWPKLTKELEPFYKSEALGLYDILLASHLWGLYLVPEFQFPARIHEYLQSVKEGCSFSYHQDYWT